MDNVFDPNYSMSEVTDETLDAWVKSTTSGIYATTGIQGIDLTGLISLIPVVTPFRESVPRVTPPQGSSTTQWRALLNVNSSQPNAAVNFDFAGSRVNYSEVNVSTGYYPLELVTTVTRDAVNLARSYADALAIGTMQNLNQLLISEDINLINSSNYPLPTIGAIVATPATTGGTIAASATPYITCAARSGSNYFYGGSGPLAAAVHPTIGSSTSTNSVSVYVPAVKGAVAYDWYVGSSATASTQYYYGTTTTNVNTITRIPASANPASSLPFLSSTIYANAGAVTAAGDTSYNAAAWMNGLIAQLLGDYSNGSIVTPGTGTSSGAYFHSNDGGQLTATSTGIQELDDLNQALWNNALLSPSRYLMSSQTAADITALMTSTGLAYTVLPPTDAQARADLAAGAYVKYYLNKAVGGRPVAIEVHPHMAPGMIIALTDQIPYPGANIDAPFQVRTLDDYYAFEYAANYVAGVAGGGPRNDIAVRALETLVVRAPVTNGVICNISPTEA